VDCEKENEECGFLNTTEILKKYNYEFMKNKRYIPMSKQTSLREEDFPVEFLSVYF
jgi:hypothetical protein